MLSRSLSASAPKVRSLQARTAAFLSSLCAPLIRANVVTDEEKALVDGTQRKLDGTQRTPGDVFIIADKYSEDAFRRFTSQREWRRSEICTRAALAACGLPLLWLEPTATRDESGRLLYMWRMATVAVGVCASMLI